MDGHSVQGDAPRGPGRSVRSASRPLCQESSWRRGLLALSTLLALCVTDISGGNAGLPVYGSLENRAALVRSAARLRGGSACMPGRSSLAETGRVADLWDVHKFNLRDDGMVAVWRHKRLGTALEVCETKLGLAIFVENDERNASFAMVHGRLRLGDERRSQGYSPLVREGRTWWDASEGFLAPDTLEALREEAGKRPMVAEWMDVGEGSGWEAFDDGSRPYVHLVNSDAQCQIFLTATGFVYVGAPAGPLQPHKPQGIIVQEAREARQVSRAEAEALVAALPCWESTRGAGVHSIDKRAGAAPLSLEPALNPDSVDYGLIK